MGASGSARGAARLRGGAAAGRAGPQAARGKRVRRRRVALALASAALATGPLAAGAALADTSPTPVPSSTTELPVTVTLDGVSPLAPQPGDTLNLQGTLHNAAGSPVTDLTVQLDVSHTKVGTRGEFDSFAGDPAGPAPVDAQIAGTAVGELAKSDLAVGADDTFDLRVPVDDLNLPEVWQGYELPVLAPGQTVPGRVTVGRLRTFLPWAPLGVPGVGLPTRLAWVWPPADRPHRTDTDTWVDDALASDFATGGRLERLLAAGATAEHQQPPPSPP